MSLDQSSLYEGLRIGSMLGRTPRTPYLEKQKIPEIENATAISIACRRLNMVRKTDRIYIAYISNGIGHVIYTDPVKYMLGHNWIHTTFEVECEDIEIRFNGRCVRNGPEGREFITEDQPWIFWVHDGRCRGQLLGSLGWMEFASENCTKVSSIIDFAKDWVSDGKGMILFLLLDGDIYYRQLIDGNWYDAELLTGTPENIKWTDISAFRTWDYRIGIQGLSTNGTVYEIFSQFEGFGKRNVENVYLSLTNISGNLFKIYYHDAYMAEHVALNVINLGALYGGLYHIGLPLIINAYNVSDNGDWGKIAVFVFDKHLKSEDVSLQPTTFRIVDSHNMSFVAHSAVLSNDGLTVILEFLNFNNAYGICQAIYIPGTIESMADTVLERTSFSFTPQNLVPSGEPAPIPISAINVGYYDARYRRVRYYQQQGSALLYTEYVIYGEDAEWGVGREWSTTIGGSADPDILNDVVVDLDLYEYHAYVELEYIASSGTQYIDTGFKPTSGNRIYVRFAITTPTTNWDTIFGTINGQKGRMTLRYSNSTSGGLQMQRSNSPRASYASYDLSLRKDTSGLNWHEVEINGTNLYLDGTLVKTFSGINSGDFPYNLFIFALNNAGNPGDYSYAKISSFKIWNEDGQLIRDYHPALDSNDTVCMYDEVNQEYVYNSGSGSFIAPT